MVDDERDETIEPTPAPRAPRARKSATRRSTARKSTTTAEDAEATPNDQLVRTVPGTDVGGHDTAGTDGEKRTERAGDLLGTVNREPGRATTDARQLETDRADFVAKEVDRANREDLPRLGGQNAPENWEPEEGGSPEFLEAQDKARSRRSR